MSSLNPKYAFFLIVFLNCFCSFSQDEFISPNNDDSLSFDSVNYTSKQMLDYDVEIQRFSTLEVDDLSVFQRGVLTFGAESEKKRILNFINYYNEELVDVLNNSVLESLSLLKRSDRFKQSQADAGENVFVSESRFMIVCELDVKSLNWQVGSSQKDLLCSDFMRGIKGEFYLFDNQAKVKYASKESLVDLLEYLDGFYKLLENKPREKISENTLKYARLKLDRLEKYKHELRVKSQELQSPEEATTGEKILGVIGGLGAVFLCMKYGWNPQ